MAKSRWSELLDEEEAPPVEVVSTQRRPAPLAPPKPGIDPALYDPGPPRVRTFNEKKAQDDRIRSIEDQLLEQTLTVLRDSLAFRDIDEGETGIPDEWMKELNDAGEARKRLRIANAAHKSAKEAPIGLAIAKSVAVGIVRARATEKGAPKVLNLTMVELTVQPPPQLEEMEVEDR
jgi:hypothetical protein